MSLKQTYLEKFLKGPSTISEAVDPADREDGIVDGLNVPLDAQARALSAKVKLPMAKRLVALFTMAGIPGRYLNAEDAEGTIMAAADMLRKKASIRKAFLDFYERLGAAQGFTAPGVTESKRSAEDGGSVSKRGNYMNKMFTTVLIELGLPETLAGVTAPAAVQAGLLRAAALIDQDSGLDRSLRTLAMRMGVKAEDIRADVQESADVDDKPVYTSWLKTVHNSSRAYVAWKDEVRAAVQDATFEGDMEDYAVALDANGYQIGEWDGKRGTIDHDAIKFYAKKDGIKESLAVDEVKTSGTYTTWKKHAKAVGKDVWFEGDVDIASAFVGAKPFKLGKTWSIGEWDGEQGEVFVTKKVPTELLKEAVEVGQDEFMNEVVAMITALGVPEDILNLRRAQLIKALRERKLTLRNRAQVQMFMRRLSDVITKNTVQRGNSETEE